ncbi:MAG: hypothetical protein JO022_18110, partial [Acidobacteriaceae bacterium]|nr:hypothetical protein [Acidobacteriaceae bacterium]
VPEIFRYWLQGGRVDVGCLGELSLSAIHPGVTVEQVRELTGWSHRVSDDVSQTPEPTELELRTLRELYARTAAAHGSSVQGE